MTVNTGGQAFPGAFIDPRFPNNNSLERPPGMTLRQWYAGQALCGILANPKFKVYDNIVVCANECFRYADALITHEEKR